MKNKITSLKIGKNTIFFCVIVLIVALEFLFLKQIVSFDEPYNRWDHVAYLRTAETAGKSFEEVSRYSFAFSHRILTPLIINLTTSDPYKGFFFLTIICVIATIYLLKVLLEKLGFEWKYATLGAILFALFPSTTGFVLFDYLLVDPLHFLLITSAFCALLSRKTALFFAIGFIAGFSKESSLLLIPFYIAFRISKGEKENTLRDILYAILIIFSGFAIPRLLIVCSAESASVLLRFLKPLTTETLFRWIVEATFRSWGALTIVPFLFLKPTKNFLKTNPEFLVYIITTYLTFFSAGEFSARVIGGLGFPAFIPIAMVNVREIVDRGIMKFGHSAFWLIVIQICFLLYFRITFLDVTQNQKKVMTLIVILIEILFAIYILTKSRQIKKLGVI